MNWKKLTNNSSAVLADIPDISIEMLREEIIKKITKEEKRIVSYFGIPENNGFRIYAITGDDETASLYIASAFTVEKEYKSITDSVPALHMFERELFEETGIMPKGHPWLKPVRYPVYRAEKKDEIKTYPFYKMDGDEIHEVGVGPIHAGVIEPGHFRFMCHGEKVYHLEIQLGYQHRNIENVIMNRMNLAKGPEVLFFPQIAEQIAGDTAVGHASTYASLMEAMMEIKIPPRAEILRAVMVELERVAVHIGDIGAILNDIGFMMGNAVFGAMRTIVINTSLSVCGSRFGKGFIKVGGVNFDIDEIKIEEIRKNIRSVKEKFEKQINATLFDQPSVLTRLEQTGTIYYDTAKSIGMTGMAARASGVEVDVRTDYPYGAYREISSHKIVSGKGDVFARTYIRYVEILQSIDFIEELLNILNPGEIFTEVPKIFPADTLGISLSEGWRGEIVHIVITGADGKIKRFKIKDPSFNNWYGLGVAVRGNGISDFPLCNKSFNLSYCGHDL